MLTIGSLFSGIGGLELGLERAGLGPVLWQVEKDEWCRAQLARHYPDASRYKDVRDATAATLRRVDVLCGGFPCQDVSSAGNRRGLAGERSGLWFEFARVVSELRPKYVVVENVASGAKLWVDAVVRELGERGYDCLPLPVSAASVGAPHRRERLFIVGRLVDTASSGRRPETRGEREAARVHGGEGREPVAIGAGSGALPDAEGTGRESGSARGPELPVHDRSGGYEPGPASALGDLAPVARGAQRPEYPPAPGDVAGWERYLAAGGPPPGIEPPIRGGSDGLSKGVARAWRERRRQHVRALKALGNAVVPECAEVAGWVIRALEEGR